MIIIATVIRTEQRSLLVRNCENNEEILVHFRNAHRFTSGDCIRIIFDGMMTRSIPPQITATSIERTQCPPPHHSNELRAVVLSTSRTHLLARDMSNSMQIRINYPFAYHFCPGQEIIVRHESMRMTNPPQFNATDIIPIC